MIDQVALVPLYVAAATALLAFLIDLVLPIYVLAVTAIGALGTAVAAWIVGAGPTRSSFCVPQGCSLVADRKAALIAVVFALLTLVVVGLSSGWLTDRVPSGEYMFLLAVSMSGGVALGYCRDLITLLVALETLTLPLYALVALRARPRPAAVSAVDIGSGGAGARIAHADTAGAVRADADPAGADSSGAESAVTFFVVSVVSTAVALLGAALLYAATGALHFGAVNQALATHPAIRNLPLTRAAAILIIAGLLFKVAAVPFHAWAPSTYDGAPTPIAAYLSTAGKLGGVVAIVYVAVLALGPSLTVTGPILAVLAAVTMTVGNLVALRQDRMVRLLAWSSIAQAGYIVAPLGAAAHENGRGTAVAAVLTYTVLFVVVEIGAFGAVIALRGDSDGGFIGDYRGAARRRPWIGVALLLALAGLAGLPPGFAGLFGKIVVVDALVTGGATWLAVVVGINVVIGLAYYVRVAGVLLAAPAFDRPPRRLPWPVAAALIGVTVLALAVGLAPETILHVANF